MKHIDAFQFHIFPTAQGWIGLTWSAQGLVALAFPVPTRELAAATTQLRHPQAAEATRLPAWVARFKKRLIGELDGRPLKSPAIPPLDFSAVPPFHRLVYQEALKIPRGQTLSYVELARRAGSPKASRAVGQAMARNPMPVLIPCHRVLSASGELGGFSAPGGLEAKKRLLELESRPRIPLTLLKDFDAEKTLQLLKKQDARLARLIQKIGPFEIKVARDRTPYQWLLRSIVFQQLSGKAAGTILDRVRAQFGGRDPQPAELLTASATDLRQAGLSRQKIAALKDLARAAAAGEVPDRRKMLRMTDEEIINTLIPIRGVGRWTVEMLLIFGLGRLDVLAVDDFAIRKSAMLLHGKSDMPDRRTLSEWSEKWRPYRTIASWYLWRSLDNPMPATK